MKDKKIILAGGTGFIGTEIIKYFGEENNIIVLTRQLSNASNTRYGNNPISRKNIPQVKFVKWDGLNTGKWAEELNDADIIINLAGKSVNCRYTEKNKKEILCSRTEPVKAIGAAIRQCSIPPKLWINASSATIYRHAPNSPQDEYNGEILDDFSVQVCKQWEETFYNQITPETRKVALRMAITLGSGGVLIPYFNLLKFGLGGKQGNGKQMFSWIHVEDTCSMIDWIETHNAIKGTYNCSSPQPVTNNDFMKTLRNITGKRLGIPVPDWMLKTGAFIIRTETELVLKSRWVIPSKILETGFQFKYPSLKNALENVILNVPRRQYKLF